MIDQQEKDKNNVVKIFIPEHIPSFNKGEAAILTGMLETFKILGTPKVTICSNFPEADIEQYGSKVKIIESKTIPKHPKQIVKVIKAAFYMFQHVVFILLYKIFGLVTLKIMKGEIWREYCNCDLIVMGHDNLFVNHIPLHFYIIFVAKLLKKPVVVYAASIGPIKDKISRFLTKISLNKVDLITLRDELSYHYLRKIGCHKSSIYVTADTAFLLQPADPEKTKEVMLKEGINKSNEPLIGFTIAKFMAYYSFPSIKSLAEKYHNYIRLKAKVIDYLTDEFKATVVLIPHVIIPKELIGSKIAEYEYFIDDRDVVTDIYNEVKNKDKVIVIFNEYTPEEIKGVIGQLDLLIGERTHTMIASTSMGVPTIAVSSRITRFKTEGIIGEMMGGKKWILEIETLDFANYTSKIMEIWSEREKIRKDLLSKAETVKEKAMLNGTLLKDLLKSWKK